MKSYLSTKKIIFTAAALFLFQCSLFADTVNDQEKAAGIITLAPALFTLIVAVISRRAVLSVAAGAFLASVIFQFRSAGVLLALPFGISGLMSGIVRAVADPWNCGLLFFFLSMGGLYSVLSKSGGLSAIAAYMETRSRSQSSAQVFAFLMGFITFFEEFASPMITGTVMARAFDRMKISRERLAFIADSMSVPLTGIMIFSTWTMYEMGVIYAAGESMKTGFDVMTLFIKTLPYKIYPILMIVFTFVSCRSLRDFGPMKRVQIRCAESMPGEEPENTENAEESTGPLQDQCTVPRMSSLFIPVGFFIAASLAGLIMGGINNISKSGEISSVFSRRGIVHVMGSADVTIVLFQASLFTLLVSVILMHLRGIMNPSRAFSYWVRGVKSVLPAALLLVVSWVFVNIMKDLGTVEYTGRMMINFSAGPMTPVMIFMISFLAVFLTGAPFGAMAFMLPASVAVAVMSPLTIEVNLPLYLGASMSGIIMGEHSSFFSNSTILSSAGAKCRHVNHFITQLPYSLTVGIISAVAFFIPAGYGVPLWVILPVSAALTAGVVLIAGRRPEGYDYY